MTVRAKFQVTEVRHHLWGGKTLVLEPRYDDKIPEDQRFAKATPSGRLEMAIDNPVAVDALPLGKTFYIDISPAE